GEHAKRSLKGRSRPRSFRATFTVWRPQQCTRIVCEADFVIPSMIIRRLLLSPGSLVLNRKILCTWSLRSYAINPRAPFARGDSVKVDQTWFWFSLVSWTALNWQFCLQQTVGYRGYCVV